ncbi:hypothetical protein PoB_006084300 [Plakobranchus ocellatus]|uniref:Uncharacterized protein n=1 Tax=Plakobranchus ocellatus TaxID=259542 RepID=A0AAV4CR44_9GAST|nr:hypothetical protein PoB_006084300 [Plakobranchus ocellatus]
MIAVFRALSSAKESVVGLETETRHPADHRGAGGGARTRDRKVPADLRADSLATEEEEEKEEEKEEEEEEKEKEEDDDDEEEEKMEIRKKERRKTSYDNITYCYRKMQMTKCRNNFTQVYRTPA